MEVLPVLSAKGLAYVQVLAKLDHCRLQKGIYPEEYTKAVNEEIQALKKRLRASVRRIENNEATKKLCAKDPAFAQAWNETNLLKSYCNAAKRERKLSRKINELIDHKAGEQE